MKNGFIFLVRYSLIILVASAALTLTSCSRGSGLNSFDDNSLSSSSSSSGSGVKIAFNSLPSSAQTYVTKNYTNNGWSVKSSEREVEDGGVIIFQVDVIKGSNKLRLYFNENGGFIRSEVK